MRSTTIELLTTALLASTLVFFSGCDANQGENTPAQAVATQAERSAPEKTEVEPEAPAIEAADATPAAIPELAEQPVLASAATTPTLEAATTPKPSTATKRPSKHELRNPSLLPAGTPEINAEAFAALPVGKRDKAPVAGVGETGIHLDEIAVGKTWASSRCEDLSASFVPGVDERISVCFRVVHPREAEQVTVEWTRDGKLRQSIRVGVRDTHAYRTRAWMPVTEGRAGQWTATVKSEDGAVLGQVAFEVAGS